MLVLRKGRLRQAAEPLLDIETNLQILFQNVIKSLPQTANVNTCQTFQTLVLFT